MHALLVHPLPEHSTNCHHDVVGSCFFAARAMGRTKLLDEPVCHVDLHAKNHFHPCESGRSPNTLVAKSKRRGPPDPVDVPHQESSVKVAPIQTLSAMIEILRNPCSYEAPTPKRSRQAMALFTGQSEMPSPLHSYALSLAFGMLGIHDKDDFRKCSHFTHPKNKSWHEMPVHSLSVLGIFTEPR